MAGKQCQGSRQALSARELSIGYGDLQAEQVFKF